MNIKESNKEDTSLHLFGLICVYLVAAAMTI